MIQHQELDADDLPPLAPPEASDDERGRAIRTGPGGDTRLAPEAERPLLSILDAFSESLAFRPMTVTV